MMSSTPRNVVAVLLALCVAECCLQVGKSWKLRVIEPLQTSDRRLGWVTVPARVAHDRVSKRDIEYAFDGAGCRVRDGASRVDPSLPTLMFTGESYMLGYGLHWSETLAAQMEAKLGIQSANFAVTGYSNDQAFMRLQDELPRYGKPVAVISVFISRLFDRNVEVTRPHLDEHLVWHQGRRPFRLEVLAKRLVDYHTPKAIERGVRMTRAVLSATIELARSRGAVPLVLVPQFEPESVREREIRREVLDEASIPYVFVLLDAGWHVGSGAHPDARADAVMADALIDRLAREWPPSGNGDERHSGS